MKFSVTRILSIVLFHCVAKASGQMTCSVIHLGSKGLQAHSEISAAQTPSGKEILNGLIEERLDLMTGVARAKWNSGSAIEDPIREQQLLADVAGKAQAVGIPPEWAQHFFRLQIEAAKEVQYCLFAQWAAKHQGPFPKVLDLRTGIRPKLDLLTAELLQALAKHWPELMKQGLSEKKEPLHEQSTNEIALHLALLPLADGSLQPYGHAGAVK